MKKAQKKSTRCLYCIDVKLAVVKKKRKKRRECGLVSLMREQGISCVSTIVVVHSRPGTDKSEKSVYRCLRVTVSRGQTTGLESESHKPPIRSTWLK